MNKAVLYHRCPVVYDHWLRPPRCASAANKDAQKSAFASPVPSGSERHNTINAAKEVRDDPPDGYVAAQFLISASERLRRLATFRRIRIGSDSSAASTFCPSASNTPKSGEAASRIYCNGSEQKLPPHSNSCGDHLPDHLRSEALVT